MRTTLAFALLAYLGFAAAASSDPKPSTCPACPASLTEKDVTYLLAKDSQKAVPGEPLFCGYVNKVNEKDQTFCSYNPDGSILDGLSPSCPNKVPVSAENCAKTP
ncbi:hypothetical protein BV22DRAFT_1009113 [Leucogyrophana mollusca]|uniref:Uncharacterized protein n=1 Tax=Leucogyrophana mollusca TaxID=85980 RepID=A0ACB8BMB3_9AGAM|nr:hypothetical protein BV22DRAFT_1009113 [Leucogyrophana mollusca]